jgi:hypothetical protein
MIVDPPQRCVTFATHGERYKAVNGPRCKAVTKAGKPCQALAGAEGLCTAHAGKTDMRELGRRGGKARRGGLAKQLPATERESLREALRAGLDHEVVVGAVRQSLNGGNESARVAAVKFLADLELYRKEGDDCPRCAQVKAEAPTVREKLTRDLERYLVQAVLDHDAGKLSGEHDAPVVLMVRRAVARAREGQEDELQAVVERALMKTVERLKYADMVVEKDVSFEEAQAVLQGLAETGVFDHLIEPRVAELQQEHEVLAESHWR